MFNSLTNHFFQLWLFYKSNLRIFTVDTIGEIIRIKHFSRYKNDDIFHIIDEIKGLSDGHVSLQMEVYDRNFLIFAIFNISNFDFLI